MPRIACTSRIDGRRCRFTMRSSAVAAVPLSAPDPYTRYTTCRPSTTTIGSATAVPRLRAPEEEEAGDRRDHGPPDRVPPESGLADDRMTVRAVIDGLRRVDGLGRLGMARAEAVQRAPRMVIGVVPRH